MLIETALMTYLLAQSGITDIVDEGDAARIYFGQALQDTDEPYIVLNKISSPRSYSQDGPDGLTDARFQFTCFAAKYGDAKTLAVAVQTAMNSFSCPGTMGGDGGVTVFSIFYDDETDLEPEELGLHGVACDYIIGHKE